MKCLLIISQYRWSRHYFIVNQIDDETELYSKCRTLIERLEDYKRSENDRPYQYGDICEKYFTGLKHRRNVNDSGDIYFIPCGAIEAALYQMRGYQRNSYREAQGYKKKAETQSIYEHHDVAKVREIVGSVFEIL